MFWKHLNSRSNFIYTPMLIDISRHVNVIDSKRHVEKILFGIFWFSVFVFSFWNFIFLYLFYRFYIFVIFFSQKYVQVDVWRWYQAVSFARNSSSAGVKHLIPIRLTRYLNLSLGRAFVNISATWYSVLTKYNSIIPFSTCSFIKWYRVWMCLVQECCTGLHEIAMAE